MFRPSKWGKKTRRASKHRKELKTGLDNNREARIIVNAAVGFAAASNPTVASVVAAYRVGKICWKTADAYDREYEQTHSHDRAVDAAKRTALKEAKNEVRGELVSIVVDGSLTPAKDSGTATFARELVKSVANEYIGELQNDERRSGK